MTDATITRALAALRVRTIREGRPGLAHVEALLQLRGCNLPPVPIKRPDNIFRRGHLRRMILQALRSAPMTVVQVSRYIAEHKPGVSYERAYQRASSALTKMKQRGMVRNGGGTWRVPN